VLESMNFDGKEKLIEVLKKVQKGVNYGVQNIE